MLKKKFEFWQFSPSWMMQKTINHRQNKGQNLLKDAKTQIAFDGFIIFTFILCT